MGTRSTTKIYVKYPKQEKKLILSLYKQFDGYLEGWGKEMKDFFKSGKVVNGLPLDRSERLFNGTGCFATQLIANFKTEPGNLYATHKDDDQEFNYTITFDYENKKVIFDCDEIDEDDEGNTIKYYEEFEMDVEK